MVASRLIRVPPPAAATGRVISSERSGRRRDIAGRRLVRLGLRPVRSAAEQSARRAGGLFFSRRRGARAGGFSRRLTAARGRGDETIRIVGRMIAPGVRGDGTVRVVGGLIAAGVRVTRSAGVGREAAGVGREAGDRRDIARAGRVPVRLIGVRAGAR